MPAIATTKVTAASVYRRGCLITRNGSVALEAGDNHVRLGGIGLGAERSSLRLRMAAGVKLIHIDVVANPLEDIFTEREEDDAVKALRAEIDAVVGRISNRVTTRNLWRDGDAKLGKGNVADFAAFADMLPDRLDALDAQIAELEEQREGLCHKLDELLSSQLGFEGEAASDQRQYVEADLVVQEAGDFAFELVYWDKDASWEPSYTISTPGADEPLSIDLAGTVRQFTGEDWEGIELTLYTGNPANASSMPQVRPRYLDFEPRRNQQKAPIASGSMRMASMPKAAACEDSAFELAAAPDDSEMALGELSTPHAEVVEHELMNAFVLPGSVDVPSGGKGVYVDVAHEMQPAIYRFNTYPEADPGVYITAQVPDGTPTELIACKAAIHLGDTYLGDVHVSESTLTAQDPLSLGRDDRINARRRLVKKTSSNVLLKGQVRTEYVYEFEVASRRKTDVSVELIGLVPVSRATEIEVEVLQLAGGTHDDKTGEVRWTLTVKAGEKVTVQLAYAVIAPKKRRIIETQEYAAPTSRYSRSGFCPACGSPLEPGMAFCIHCGTRV